jgi:hypothetical protein
MINQASAQFAQILGVRKRPGFQPNQFAQTAPLLSLQLRQLPHCWKLRQIIVLAQQSSAIPFNNPTNGFQPHRFLGCRNRPKTTVK